MPGSKSIAIIIGIFIFILLVIYDTHSNKESIFRVLISKIHNSSTAGHHEHPIYHNFTKDRVIELKRLIDEMREHYGVKAYVENRTSGQRNRSANTRKVVLAYTKYFGEKPWPWMRNSYEFNHWEGIECPHYSCELTFNRRDRPTSDALIFHSRDMPFIDTLRYALKRKTPNQRWIYYAMESPLHILSTRRLINMFNWTMSYRNDSDIFRPYSYYFESSSLPKRPANTYLEGKDRLVFWAASHCDLLRDDYVKKLLTYINVDVFGACRSTVGAKDVGSCPQDSPKCEKKLQRYKFQLAFENCNCVDYVTEKYWHGITKGIVPVVMGGAGYAGRTAIPGSFINVMDFKSVKALADYLVFLDKNDEEYVKYFAWKSKYRVTNYPPWNCQLCARLYLDSEFLFYESLDKSWGAEKNCGIDVKALERMTDTSDTYESKGPDIYLS